VLCRACAGSARRLSQLSPPCSTFARGVSMSPCACITVHSVYASDIKMATVCTIDTQELDLIIVCNNYARDALRPLLAKSNTRVCFLDTSCLGGHLHFGSLSEHAAKVSGTAGANLFVRYVSFPERLAEVEPRELPHVKVLEGEVTRMYLDSNLSIAPYSGELVIFRKAMATAGFHTGGSW